MRTWRPALLAGAAALWPLLAQAADNPFGVAPSASSSRSLSRWVGPMAEAGVGWVRGFSPTLDPAQTARSLPA